MEDPLDPEFARMFEPSKRPPCQLYLISPLDVGGDFPGRLERALGGGPVAAFQLRLKDVEDFEVLRAGEGRRPILAA